MLPELLNYLPEGEVSIIKYTIDGKTIKIKYNRKRFSVPNVDDNEDKILSQMKEQARRVVNLGTREIAQKYEQYRKRVKKYIALFKLQGLSLIDKALLFVFGAVIFKSIPFYASMVLLGAPIAYLGYMGINLYKLYRKLNEIQKLMCFYPMIKEKNKTQYKLVRRGLGHTISLDREKHKDCPDVTINHISKLSLDDIRIMSDQYFNQYQLSSQPNTTEGEKGHQNVKTPKRNIS